MTFIDTINTCTGCQAREQVIKELEADLERWRRGYNNMTVDSKNERIKELEEQLAAANQAGIYLYETMEAELRGKT